MLDRRSFGAAAALTCLFAGATVAEPKYGPGTSATEIKVGQTIAYSGPASAYGNFGKAEVAYMRMVNDHGGVNGRKINLISVDDGYLPPRSLERRHVPDVTIARRPEDRDRHAECRSRQGETACQIRRGRRHIHLRRRVRGPRPQGRHGPFAA